ncbi:hypothetical protein IIB79_09340 [candidate division KSB1 bacterium]|nr:hypothetical protein [candidate division KSB1 bacterium]
MEQPKDFEELLKEDYYELNLWGKITYFLEDHIWKAIFIAGFAGFITGICFDRF